MPTVLDAPEGFTFGADPELFIFNPEGQPVCADGLIPGTKSDPYKVKDGAVQVDGFAAEFNIDPVTTFKEFTFRIDSVVGQLKAMLPEGYTLQAVPSVVFSEEEWNNAPDAAKELGCSPDFNAWTGRPNPMPIREEGSRLACAGGHLHVGWTTDASLGDMQHITNCCDLVKQYDYFLGLWSLLMDKDPTRRSLYGKAGACRFKDYGVEYRSLSNFWVLNKNARLAVWNRMMSAIKYMNNMYLPEKYFKWNSSVVEAIDYSIADSSVITQFTFPVRQITY